MDYEDWHPDEDDGRDEDEDRDNVPWDDMTTEEKQAFQEELLQSVIDKLPASLKSFILRSHVTIKIDVGLKESGHFLRGENTILLKQAETDSLKRELVHAYQRYLGTMGGEESRANVEFQEHAFGSLMSKIGSEAGEYGHGNDVVPNKDRAEWERFLDSVVDFSEELTVDAKGNNLTEYKHIVDLDKWEEGVVDFMDEFQERYSHIEGYSGPVNDNFNYEWEKFFNMFDVKYK